MTQTDLERLARIEEKVDGLVRKLDEFIQDTRRHRDHCDAEFKNHEERLRDLELEISGLHGGLSLGHKALVIIATLCSIAAFFISMAKL